MTSQVDAGAPYSYGYEFWLRDIAGHHVAMAWGSGGQMIYIIKDPSGALPDPGWHTPPSAGRVPIPTYPHTIGLAR
jgi:hypothetical protein